MTTPPQLFDPMRLADDSQFTIDENLVERLREFDHIIVSGPSGVGKSTLAGLLHARKPEWFGEHDVIHLAQFAAGRPPHLPKKSMLHCNILAPVWFRIKQDPAHFFSNGAAPAQLAEFYEHQGLERYFQSARGRVAAVVIAASRESLIQRASQRTITEPFADLDPQGNAYPSEQWTWIMRLHDFDATYAAWLRYLNDKGIECIPLVSADSGFRSVDRSPASFKGFPAIAAASLSDSELKIITATEPFEYQTVAADHRSHVSQQDRSETARLIYSECLQEGIAGASVLDVGCASGYFSFEAEQRGAARVVGVELKPVRYRQALLLRYLKGSSVEFHNKSIFDFKDADGFDVVLCLNVIHHLPDPVSALSIVSNLTRKTLVLEFPTLTDRKFQACSNFLLLAGLLNRLPLIGVSTMREAQQRFVFTAGAIERILCDHLQAFKQIRFLKSPLKNRLVAICQK